MPEIASLKHSKYLSKEDCKSPILLTFANPSVTNENVALEGAAPEMRWCGHFAEIAKMMVLNTTNLELAARVTGQTNTDNWPGRKVVVYVDPNVQMGGRLVGGLRIRAPRQAAAPPAVVVVAPAPAAPLAEPEGIPGEESDDMPF